MQCLSRALDGVRVALLGRRTTGRHSSACLASAASGGRSDRLTPDVRGAGLVAACVSRGDRYALPATWEDTGAMDRPCVLAYPDVSRSALQHVPAPGEAAS